MSTIAPSHITNGANYTYPNQLPLSEQIPPNAQSSPVTPPESTASGTNVPGCRHEDVGRLSDMEEGGIGTEETSPTAIKPGTKMVNIRHNGKITVCDEKPKIFRVHPSSLAHQKEVLKDMIENINAQSNYHQLIVLQGADDGVPIHRTLITYYSKFVDEHIVTNPECSTIFLPSYSQKTLKKVVALLYSGICYFSEQEKKSVNLVWEAMRYLKINVNENSFFYHPVECSVVKEEVEDPEDQIPAMPAIDPTEVDQTDEHWYEDDSQTTTNGYAGDFTNIDRIQHPENPSKNCSVFTVVGEGKRILRGLPAMKHINGDDIEAENAIKDKEITKQLLEKNTISVVDLEDDEDDECPTPAKKSRTKTYSSSTTIVRDEEFKRLIASGKVNVNMIKEATANRKNPVVAVPSTSSAPIDAPIVQNDSLCSPPAPFQHEDQLGDIATSISANIPANNPDRTGITIMQPSTSPIPEDGVIKDEELDEEISSPPSPTKSISGMPTLQLATGTECQLPKRRTVHAKSLDITEGPVPTLPTLDRMMIDDDNQGTLGENEFFPDVTHGSTFMLLAPAAVIPKARLNNRQIPSISASVASQMENGGSGQRTPRNKRPKMLVPPSPDIVEATAEMRVAYAKEEELKNKCFIVASKKIPVPDDLRGDNIHYYVENMEQNDDELIKSLPESSRAILNRHKTSTETQLVADTPAPAGKRRSKIASEKGTGRGRGRPPKIANLKNSYPDVTMTEVETENQANASNQPESSGQTRPVRSRGSGRKGSRGGGRGK